MTSATGVLTGFIVPTLATVLCNVMWLSPMPAVLEARQSKCMVKLDPVPFGMTVFNCIGWMVYGLLLRDYFIVFSNIFGILFGLFYVINSLVLLSLKHEAHQIRYSSMERFILVGTFFWCVVGFVIGMVTVSNKEMSQLIVGISANTFTIFFYVSPAQLIRRILRERDASFLNVPMVWATLLNSCLWFVYGMFALNDPQVYSPNFLGSAVCATELCLRYVYGGGGQSKNDNAKTAAGPLLYPSGSIPNAAASSSSPTSDLPVLDGGFVDALANDSQL